MREGISLRCHCGRLAGASVKMSSIEVRGGRCDFGCVGLGANISRRVSLKDAIEYQAAMFCEEGAQCVGGSASVTACGHWSL